MLDKNRSDPLKELKRLGRMRLEVDRLDQMSSLEKLRFLKLNLNLINWYKSPSVWTNVIKGHIKYRNLEVVNAEVLGCTNKALSEMKQRKDSI